MANSSILEVNKFCLKVSIASFYLKQKQGLSDQPETEIV